jgi:hypothetical protein
MVQFGPNSDNKHPEADVSVIDVSQFTYNFIYLLITNTRKRAGASEQASGATAGMSESMKERAKEALAGRTGETDDED